MTVSLDTQGKDVGIILLSTNAIPRTCVERLERITVIACKLFIPKEALRMVTEGVAEVFVVVVHSPLMDSHHSLSHQHFVIGYG